MARAPSLSLRVQLIALGFAIVAALVLVGLGGLQIHRQQQENAQSRARLAADELVARAERLIALDLALDDFIGFDAQCDAVLRRDGTLSAAVLYDVDRRPRFASGQPLPDWPAGLAPPSRYEFGAVQTPAGLLVARAVTAPAGPVVGFVTVAVDGGELRRATLERLRGLLAGAAVLIVVGIALQHYVFWRQLGRPLTQLVHTADAIGPDEDPPRALLEHRRDDEIGHVHAALLRLVTRLREARRDLVEQNERLEQTVRERTAQLERANAELARDIERRRSLEQDLRLLANTDALTGLANRASVMPYLQRQLDGMQSDQRRFGVMLIDFDRFKPINDLHGHHIGDEVLCEMARRLQAICRRSDVVARIGGDEFLLIFARHATGDEDVEALARRVLAVFEPAIAVRGLQLHVGASAGIALCPEHSCDADGLLAQADAAMYAVKRAGGGWRLAARG